MRNFKTKWLAELLLAVLCLTGFWLPGHVYAEEPDGGTECCSCVCIGFVNEGLFVTWEDDFYGVRSIIPTRSMVTLISHCLARLVPAGDSTSLLMTW